MSYLSMVEAKLPPGFRFHPRDDELICDYLTPKVASSGDGSAAGNSCPFAMMVDIDLNKCEPWDLPGEKKTLTPFVHSFTHALCILMLFCYLKF